MTCFSSKWILSHSTWYKNRRSRHLLMFATKTCIQNDLFILVVVRRTLRTSGTPIHISRPGNAPNLQPAD